MVSPAILTRMIERNKPAIMWIVCGDIGAFETIASEAGERKIVESSRATMLFADYVVRFMRGEPTVFWNPTEFAAAVRTFDYFPTEWGGGYESYSCLCLSLLSALTFMDRGALPALPAVLALRPHTNEGHNVIEEHHTIQFVRFLGGESADSIAVLQDPQALKRGF